MGKILAVSVAFCLMAFSPLLQAQDVSSSEAFSPDQLDNLLAPIALYPDPLLAQVLVAATFPDQIDQAGRFVRDDSRADDVDGQPWDVSVKAVAHYPTVLGMMADKLDWTTSLGQAYVSQSTDVMASVQRLRAQARSAGNLVTTPQMQVVDSGGDIQIWPAQPQYLYVPVYDPAAVYFRRTGFFFGLGFAIGAWLDYDFDWRLHRVFYHGWEGGGGWMERSRPFVHLNTIYVNNRYRNVVINRTVIDRRVNYIALNRYDDVHRTTNFNHFRVDNRVVNRPPPLPVHDTFHNTIINRNINTRDPRINDYRGHLPGPPVQVHVPDAPAFIPNRGGFDPRVASQRGQISRVHVPPPPVPVVRRNLVTPPPRPSAHQEKDRKKH